MASEDSQDPPREGNQSQRRNRFGLKLELDKTILFRPFEAKTSGNEAMPEHETSPNHGYQPTWEEANILRTTSNQARPQREPATLSSHTNVNRNYQPPSVGSQSNLNHNHQPTPPSIQLGSYSDFMTAWEEDHFPRFFESIPPGSGPYSRQSLLSTWERLHIPRTSEHATPTNWPMPRRNIMAEWEADNAQRPFGPAPSSSLARRTLMPAWEYIPSQGAGIQPPYPPHPQSATEEERQALRPIKWEEGYRSHEPYHQFVYQVRTEARRLDDLARSNLENTDPSSIVDEHLNSQEIEHDYGSSIAYKNIKKAWETYGIWGATWVILPGVEWEGEDTLAIIETLKAASAA